ncbi:uncharacterized protein FFE2_04871 [Fusarium fujikuroi]|nr:uncharacterized protein FFE2_04871 [Fusarium fujikuroi]
MAHEAKYLFLKPLTGVPEKDELPRFLGRIHPNPLQPLQSFRPDTDPPYNDSTRPKISAAQDITWLINKAKERLVGTKLSNILDAWFKFKHQGDADVNAKTVRVYTLRQELDYFNHLLETNEQVEKWVREKLDSGERLFLSVGLISVLHADFKVLQAIQAERKAKVSLSDLLAHSSGVEFLKQMNIDIHLGSEDSNFKLLSGRFIEEHLVGIQYREITYKRRLWELLKTGQIELRQQAAHFKNALMFGDEETSIDKGKSYRMITVTSDLS